MSAFDARPPSPRTMPAQGRRLIIFAFYDPRGEVRQYVSYALEKLREHSEHIIVIVNGLLTERGRAQLIGLADEIVVRENRGFDVTAQRAALDHLGSRVRDFDEVVLTNDTWFGPVRPFLPVLARMANQAVHFWGMTSHGAAPNPLTGDGSVPYHLQSFWIAARREMVSSNDWRDYWRELPSLDDYNEAVLLHEVLFTAYFSERGWQHAVAFPDEHYPSENPSLFNAELLVRDGCPLLKRRVFLQRPPELDRRSVVDRWTLEEAEAGGYPRGMILDALVRAVEPKVINANLSMLEVLPESAVSYDEARPQRIVVVAHIFYVEMTGEILDFADTLPDGYDLVVTTPDRARADAIRADINGRKAPGGRRVEVRVVESNEGRDQSAFLVGVRDILLDGAYDLVVKLHSKQTPQDGFNVGRHFKRQQFENLLAGPGYTANLVGLFQADAALGIVFPPTIHIGYPTLGHGWWANKPGFARVCQLLGIQVPPDEISPLAPYGSMFIARPEALRLLVQRRWDYRDFGGPDAYRDGGLAHILERVPVYAVGELGYHARTVCTASYFATSHTALEFTADLLSATLPGDQYDQIELLRRSGSFGHARLRDFGRIYLRRNFPGLGAKLRRVLAPVVNLRRRLRKRTHPRWDRVVPSRSAGTRD